MMRLVVVLSLSVLLLLVWVLYTSHPGNLVVFGQFIRFSNEVFPGRSDGYLRYDVADFGKKPLAEFHQELLNSGVRVERAQGSDFYAYFTTARGLFVYKESCYILSDDIVSLELSRGRVSLVDGPSFGEPNKRWLVYRLFRDWRWW